MRTNTEFTVERRRNWKGEVFDYDAIKAYALHECQYCLTDAQIAVLGGLIETLGWTTRWQSDTQQIDEAWVRDFKNDIARRLMMGCCDDKGLIYTYDENGNLQVSSDGGATFNPAPQDDIRINPKTKLPTLPGSDGLDKKCIAATGATTLLKEQIGDQLTDDMSRYTLSQLISDWTTTIIGTSDPFEAFLRVVSNQIFALVISAIRPALTTDVYSTFECILFCRMNTAAFFSEAAWELVRSDILSQISGIAGIFLEHLVYLLGNGGLSNLARAGGATSGDCETCCPSCVGNFTWPTSVFGANSTIVIDEDMGTITAEALETNPGTWYWAFQSTVCCTCTVEVTSGTPAIAFRGVIPCPTLPSFSYGDESVPPWVLFTLPINNTPAFVVYMRSVGQPFTAKLTLVG